MSMRATFTTEFIYDGSDGFLERKAKMSEVLGIKLNLAGGNVLGRLSGITRGSDLSEADILRWIPDICYELEKITIVPFKIIWLLEGGYLIMKDIQPK